MNKTTILMLLLLCGNLTGFAQTTKPVNADQLLITREILNRNYENNGKTRSVFTIVNNSKQAFPATGWAIYFNSRPLAVDGADRSLAQIDQVNGDLFRLIPLKSFKGIKPGASQQITVLSEEIKNTTDFASAFYVVWDNNKAKGYAIKNTNIRPEKLIEASEATAAEHLFHQNTLVKDLPSEGLPKVFPTPLSYKEGEGAFPLTPDVAMITDPLFEKEAAFFSEELLRILGKKPVMISEANRNAIVLQKDESLGAEGYKLSITPEKIIISAAQPAGAFYGLQSLKTLFPAASWAGLQQEIAVPAVEIEDAPRFGFRGFMMDVARNFQSKKEVLKALDVMALYKMNVLHFHIIDDEGWRLEIPGLPELTTVGANRGHTMDDAKNLMPSFGSGPYPGIGSGSGFYSRKDYIEILKYAAARHIRVIPEIETPGHARAAIKSMDARYARLIKAGKKAEAERYLLRDLNDKSNYRSVQGWNDNVINVALPSVYTFLEKVVDEIRAMYTEAGAPLTTIHFGGDEVPAGVWEKSPVVAALLKKNREIKGVDEMWHYYFSKVNAIMKSRNLYVSGWEEIGLRKATVNGEKKMVLDTRFSKENFHADVWNNLSGNEDLAYKLANAGYKVVLTCVTNLYMDLAVNKSFDESGQYWGGYVDVDKPFYFIPYDLFKNIKEDERGNPINREILAGKESITEAGKSNIVGIQAPLWSEIIRSPELFEYMLLPKLLGVAERAWSKDPKWALENNTATAEALYGKAWSEFLNIIAKHELPRLDHYAGGYNYRIPTPGIVVKDGNIEANVLLPGFEIRYTTDGTEPSNSSKLYTAPVPATGTVKLKVFNAAGRGGRSVKIAN